MAAILRSSLFLDEFCVRNLTSIFFERLLPVICFEVWNREHYLKIFLKFLEAVGDNNYNFQETIFPHEQSSKLVKKFDKENVHACIGLNNTLPAGANLER